CACRPALRRHQLAMPDFSALGYPLLCGLWAILAIAFVTWLVSLVKSDVSIVDSVWSLLILSGGIAYAVTLPQDGPRTPLMLVLAVLWAARLAGYITWRN